ncbi:MAG: P22 phage major capsid protein family protein [Plesiomonas shigelloides]
MAVTGNNADSNVSSIVLKSFAPKFENETALMKTVDRQLIQGEIDPNTGDTVFLKRPHQYKTERTADGDLTGKSASALISGKIPAKISNYCTVFVKYSQIEQAIKLNQLDTILEPVVDAMNTALELELGRFIMANGALSLGTPGTGITKWSDVAQCGSFLRDLGVTGRNYAVMDPWAAQNLADKQTTLDNPEMVRTAWERALIPGNFAGVTAMTSNGLAARVSGSAAGASGITVKTQPTVDYATVKDSYTMTVVLTGATGLTLKAGDQLEFATSYWINQQSKQQLVRNGSPVKFTATVLADATAAGADITVTLSGVAIVDSNNPQYNTVSSAITAGMAVSVKGAASSTYKPNLFFNEKAIAMGTVELPKLHALDSSVMSSAKSGLSIRVHKFSDGITNMQMMRFDILPSFAMLNPMMAGQFHGNP